MASPPAWVGAQLVTHAIAMHATAYAPLALTVKRSDTVLWVKKAPSHTRSRPWASLIPRASPPALGGSTRRKVGNYSYICTFHPNMVDAPRAE